MSPLETLQQIVADPPDVWGEGALFAFSGLDGPTCSTSSFVGSLWSPRYDILFHLQRPHRLRLRVPEPSETVMATGDVLAARTPSGPLLVAWSAWHTIVGILPAGVQPGVTPDPGDPAGTWALVQPPNAGVQDLSLAVGPNGRFAIGFGGGPGQAADRARAGLGDDPWTVAEDRLHSLRNLRSRCDALLAEDPRRKMAGLSPRDSRLLNKCLSVMRVNTLSAEGAIRQTWSTPDRIPHRHMWLWDSVFHTMAMSPIDPDTAWRYLKSVMDFALPDGLIPITMGVDGARASDVTQPPVLAWGVWWNYLHSGDKRRLEEALPKIEGYLRWDMEHRDRNGNGLLEWAIEDKSVCRCGESGMDNSPRFDAATPLDAVDFSAFLAHEMHIAGLIARELDQEASAAQWFDRATRISRKIHTDLWDASRGFYCDRDFQGRSAGVEAESGFTPLLLEDCPATHVDALAAALRDPNRFATPVPVPSVARSHPAFSHDMWRGPAWANYNFLISLGLRRHGQAGEADRVARATVDAARKYYESHGVLFEYYDAMDERPPADCDRKGKHTGRYLSRPCGDAVRDYHWTGALTACHLLGIDGGGQVPTGESARAVLRPNPKQRAFNALTAGVPFDLFAAATADRAARGRFPAAPPEALERWRDGRVGMFVHWNPSSVRPCTISWAMNYGSVMPDEYYGLARRFNPTRFDAREWAELIRGCGFASLLFVVKHHDSFAMWDTSTTDLKITNTPFGRDLWRELIDACHAAGLRIGAYYSPADWRHPAARRGDWPTYCRFMRDQWTELFSRYGQLDTFECDYWQDFCPGEDWESFYHELRRLQPSALFSRNTAWARGDFEVHEWSVGEMTYDGMPPGPPPHQWSAMPNGAPWVSLMSVDGRRWWSYNPDPCVSFDRMMAWVLTSVLNDGNILCNFTPGPTGAFPEDQIRLMCAFRDWMNVNGDSIRATRGGPYLPLYSYADIGSAAADAAPVMLSRYQGRTFFVPRVGSTRRGNRIFLHVIEAAPGDRLEIPSPGPALRGARLLADPRCAVAAEERNGGAIALQLPPRPAREIDQIVVLDFAGSVMGTKPMPLGANAGG